jgi:hypothetical protein
MNPWQYQGNPTVLLYIRCGKKKSRAPRRWRKDSVLKELIFAQIEIDVIILMILQ